LRTIREILREIPFYSVLDVGCGEGVSLLQVGRVLPVTKLVGFDLDPRRVKLGVQTVQDANLFIANAHGIPISDASFDIVLCLETLEHVGEPLLAISEIARITKRYVLFSIPNEPWWRLGNMARLKYLSDFGNTPGHINHWTVSGFNKIILSDFRILKTARPFLWNFVLAEKIA
jgi:ubiquinone/menaquinone biosynthesis C-methylase UbiE